jgi:hypothetical protein
MSGLRRQANVSYRRNAVGRRCERAIMDALRGLWFAFKQISVLSRGFYGRPGPNIHALATFSVKC